MYNEVDIMNDESLREKRLYKEKKERVILSILLVVLVLVSVVGLIFMIRFAKEGKEESVIDHSDVIQENMLKAMNNDIKGEDDMAKKVINIGFTYDSVHLTGKSKKGLVFYTYKFEEDKQIEIPEILDGFDGEMDKKYLNPTSLRLYEGSTDPYEDNRYNQYFGFTSQDEMTKDYHVSLFSKVDKGGYLAVYEYVTKNLSKKLNESDYRIYYKRDNTQLYYLLEHIFNNNKEVANGTL